MTDTRGPQTQQYAGGAGPAAPGGSAQALPPAQPAASEKGASSQASSPQAASPLPGERQPQQPAGPYHPPQAYPAQAPDSGVRRPRTGARTTPRVRKARLPVPLPVRKRTAAAVAPPRMRQTRTRPT